MEPAKEQARDRTKTAVEQRQHRRSSYFEQLLSKYEKRNATLEARQAALAERVKFMECALPSLLMGAVINSSAQKDSEVSRSKNNKRYEERWLMHKRYG